MNPRFAIVAWANMFGIFGGNCNFVRTDCGVKQKCGEHPHMTQRCRMDRRTYLATGIAASVPMIAGCSNGSSDPGSSDPTQETYLPEPDRQVAAAKLPYPAYGQRLPEVTLPAPLRDEEVAVHQFETDVLVTFIYSYCQTVCPRLVSTLRNIQTQAIEDGYGDEVTFITITFDPERDTEDRLRTYGDYMNVDMAAGNWYFLRPESAARAKTVVQDEFGVGFQRTEPEDMDRYMFNHFSLILLGNMGGHVERAYTNKKPTWQEIYDDFTTLREQEGSDAAT